MALFVYAKKDSGAWPGDFMVINNIAKKKDITMYMCGSIEKAHVVLVRDPDYTGKKYHEYAFKNRVLVIYLTPVEFLYNRLKEDLTTESKWVIHCPLSDKKIIKMDFPRIDVLWDKIKNLKDMIYKTDGLPTFLNDQPVAAKALKVLLDSLPWDRPHYDFGDYIITRRSM